MDSYKIDPSYYCNFTCMCVFWDFNCIKSMMTEKEGESYETNFDNSIS